MKVLLINPPYNALKNVQEYYWPIGLGYVGTYLKKCGHNVLVYNSDLYNLSDRDTINDYKDTFEKQVVYKKALSDITHPVWEELLGICDSFKPDVIGITAMSAKIESAVNSSKFIKKLFPDVPIVVGGPHATIAPEEVLKTKEIDFVIRGEGEYPMAELCRQLHGGNKCLEKIQGLSYRSQGQIKHNEDISLEKNLGIFGFPDRDIFEGLGSYSKDKIACLITARGCPYNCTFCASKQLWTKRVRFREVSDVIDELKYLKSNYEIPSFYFWDDTFTVNRRRTMAILDKIEKEHINLPWFCTTRIDHLDDELIKRMVGAGCINADIGLETASNNILKCIKKGFTIEEFYKTTSLMEKNGLNYGVFLMVGFPDEKEADVLETIEYAKNSTANSLCLSIFTPYPGSEAYDQAKNIGLIPDNIDWSSLSHQSLNNYFSPNIEEKRFRQLVEELTYTVDLHNKRMNTLGNQLKRKFRFYTKNQNIFVEKLTQRFRPRKLSER